MQAASSATVDSTSPCTLHHGDCLALLPTLAGANADAIIVDPPYASGGRTLSARQMRPSDKYTQSGSQRFADVDFAGDQLDQRSWTHWCGIWLNLARQCVRPGGYLLMFVDWRQLPSATDALQMAGWLWRGLAVWDKGNAARAPHPAYFRHQCEYIVWATNGAFDRTAPLGTSGPFSGVYMYPVLQSDKHHPTGKPTPLLRQLVRQVVAPDHLVIDPFAGSGTTGVAAILEGRRFIGSEIELTHHTIATQRLQEAAHAAATATPTHTPRRDSTRPPPRRTRPRHDRHRTGTLRSLQASLPSPIPT
jgi:site-specific DNA-methyltransferase (adenine-specific)